MSILTLIRRGQQAEAPAVEPGVPADPKARKPLTTPEVLSVVGLSLPAIGGAVLSWHGMSEAASAALGPWFGPIVPIVVDGTIFSSAVRWVTAVRAGRRAGHWRTLTHLCVVLTVGLNAYASTSVELAPWHVVAPLLWSLLVEFIARDAAGEHDAEAGRPVDKIPFRLWWSAPAEQWRAVLRMARTGERSAKVARAEADAGQAAITALRLVLPRRRDRRVRRELESRILAGSLAASEAFGMVERIGTDGRTDAEKALLDALKIAATRDGSERMGRTDGGADGSERVGADAAHPFGADGSPEPLGLERFNAARAGAGRLPIAANGSASARRPAVGVGGGRPTNGKPARPEDLEIAASLIASGDLDHAPTADAIVEAFRQAGHRIGLGYARPVRDHLSAGVNGHERA